MFGSKKQDLEVTPEQEAWDKKSKKYSRVINFSWAAFTVVFFSPMIWLFVSVCNDLIAANAATDALLRRDLINQGGVQATIFVLVAIFASFFSLPLARTAANARWFLGDRPSKDGVKELNYAG